MSVPATALSTALPVRPLPIPRSELFTPRIHRAFRGDLTHSLDHALDTVREVRAEITPEDVSVRLDRREARPVVGGAPVTAAWDDDAGQSRRYRYPWALVPLDGLPGDGYALRETAFQQLLGRVRFRRDHLERFPAGYQHRMLNHLVQANGEDEQVTVRLARGNEARALVTEAYTPFDDVDLLDAVRGAITDRPDLASTARLAWLDIREEGTHVRIVWGEETAIRVGDIVRRGLHISNSEVGRRSVRIEAVVYRLVCGNGLVVPRVTGHQALRHVGDRVRLRGAVADAILDATGEAEAAIAAFRRSLDVPIPNPPQFLDDLTDTEPAFTEEHLRSVLAAWDASGAEATLYGVTNAMTLAAQAYAGERRYDLEALAGRLLTRGAPAAA